MTDTRSRRLASPVPLVCSADGCFLYGDEEKRIVEARPMYPLFIATRVPSDITFKSLISGIRPAQPRNGNAFYLGLPTLRYPKPSSFDLSVQFCRIPEEDYHRAGDLRFDERIHPGYFREAIWL